MHGAEKGGRLKWGSAADRSLLPQALCEGLRINHLSSDCSHSPNSPCKKVKGCEKKGKS